MAFRAAKKRCYPNNLRLKFRKAFLISPFSNLPSPSVSSKVRNIFFLLGVVSVVVMVVSFDMTLDAITENLVRAGRWFVLACLLWLGVYSINALGWRAIIHDGSDRERIPFWRILKFTITGFSLNTVTPVGLMGGEPYRIMELKPYIGVERATSSTLLYVMMHIFSHFWFWMLSVVLYITCYAHQLSVGMGVLLALTAAFCTLAIYIFMRGYKKGFTLRLIQGLTHVPFIRGWAMRFVADKRQTLQEIDQQIAALHATRPATFYFSLGCELGARILSSVEILIFLHLFGVTVGLADGILILGFTSLFANALFFLPMQLGAREGGFAMAAGGLMLTAGVGVSLGLLIRLRELVCVVVGLALMKVGNRPSQVSPSAENES